MMSLTLDLPAVHMSPLTWCHFTYFGVWTSRTGHRHQTRRVVNFTDLWVRWHYSVKYSKITLSTLVTSASN